MTYELVKQLKEAGYPIKEHLWYDNFMSMNDVCSNCVAYKDGSEFPWCIPILSELIKECGDKFYALVRDDETLKWRAMKDRGDLGLEGLTPEEAVANLWLELNKKSK